MSHTNDPLLRAFAILNLKKRTFTPQCPADGTTILKLPEEILLLIFRNIDSEFSPYDKVRLVCRTFNRVASELLLSSIDVAIDSKSLSHLLEVSNHPTIRKGIRRIRLDLSFHDSEIVSDLRTFGMYQAQKLAAALEVVNHDSWCDYPPPMANFKLLLDRAQDMAETWDHADEDIDELQHNHESCGGEDSWAHLLFSGQDEFYNGYAPCNQKEHCYRTLLLAAYERYTKVCQIEESMLSVEQGSFFLNTLSTAIARMSCATELAINDSDEDIYATLEQSFMNQMIGIKQEESLMQSMLRPIAWNRNQRADASNVPVGVLLKLPPMLFSAGVTLTSLAIAVTLPKSLLVFETNSKTLRALSNSLLNLRKVSFVALCGSNNDTLLLQTDNERRVFRYYLSALFSLAKIQHIDISLSDFYKVINSSNFLP